MNGLSMSDDTKPAGEVRTGRRIAKVIARSGLCSRRDAEAWIAAGRVSVNGQMLESPAYNVTEADDVRVDGTPLAAPERTRLFLFHKPRGLVTTARDPDGRATIFDALPPDLPRLVAVGRLDVNTEGLLLLTNDGGLARVLELPATGWLRRYRVRAHGHVDQARLEPLGDGLTLDGVHYAGIEARLDREQGSNAWITMGLREGKNREIKKVLEHLGLAVNRLIRISFGPFELGDLAEGEVAEVRTRVLRDQLGAKLAREAGANFDAPIVERAAELPPHEERRGREPSRRERPSGVKRSPAGARGRGPATAPRRAPAPSTPERRRKHVSALRAEIAADAAGPRKRVERSATHDRKGRTIAVERLTPAAGEVEVADKRASRKGGVRAFGERREFPEQKRDRAERPMRPDSVKRARDGEGRAPPVEGKKQRSKAGPRRAPAGDAGPRERRFDRTDGERSNRAGGAPRTPRNAEGRFRERKPDHHGDRSGKGRGRDAPSRSPRPPGNRPPGKGRRPGGPTPRKP